MNFQMLTGKVLGSVLLITMLISCKDQPKEVEITERRELTQYDNPSVYRSGYEKWAPTQPLEWRRIARTKFRQLNYAAGEATQIAVGQSNGGVLANLNRWRGEFSQDALENLDDVESFEMLGKQKAYVVKLKGTYQTKMGGRTVNAENWAVTGVICDLFGGSVLTIKMMGPEAEVMAEQENLMKFAKSMRINKLQTPSERSKENKKEEVNKEGSY